MYIQKEYSTFHEKTNMAAYYFPHRNMANEMWRDVKKLFSYPLRTNN